MQISGKTIGLFTLPGILIHELAHYLACVFFGVKVHSFVHDTFSNADESSLGYVTFTPSESPFKNLIISASPIFINIVVAISIFIPLCYLTINNEWRIWYFPIIYFGFCVAFHSVPSRGDINAISSPSSYQNRFISRLAFHSIKNILSLISRGGLVLGIIAAILSYICAYIIASQSRTYLFYIYLGIALCFTYLLYKVAKYQKTSFIVLILRLASPLIAWIWSCVSVCAAVPLIIWLALIAGEWCDYLALQVALNSYPAIIVGILTVILFAPFVIIWYGLNSVLVRVYEKIKTAIDNLIIHIELNNSKWEIIYCINCKQKLRIPKNYSSIRVTCPICKEGFYLKK